MDTNNESFTNFTVLLHFKDAKRKGRIKVSSKQNFTDTIFQTFEIPHEDYDKYTIEYFTKMKSYDKLPNDIKKIPEKVKILIKEKEEPKEKEIINEPNVVVVVDDDDESEKKIKNWKMYSNSKFGMKIQYPEEFIYKVFDFPGQPLISISFVDPKNQMSQIIFSLEDHPIKLTVDEYYERSIMSLKMMGTKINSTPPEKLKKCGHDALISKYSLENVMNNKSLYVWQGCITFEGKRSYSLQAIMDKKNDPNLKIAEKMFKTLNVFKSKAVGSFIMKNVKERFEISLPNERFGIQKGFVRKGNLIFESVMKDDSNKKIEILQVLKFNEEKEKVLTVYQKKRSNEKGFFYDKSNELLKYEKDGRFVTEKIIHLKELVKTYLVSFHSKIKDYEYQFDSFEYFNSEDNRKLSENYITYENKDFCFSVSYPCYLHSKEHANVDPVFFISPNQTMDSLMSSDHYEMTISCRGLPENMTAGELNDVLKQEYEKNEMINLKSISTGSKSVNANFTQCPEGIEVDYHVTCFLVCPDKCITLRLVVLKHSDNRESIIKTFKKIKATFEFDVEKIKDNKNYVSII